MFLLHCIQEEIFTFCFILLVIKFLNNLHVNILLRPWTTTSSLKSTWDLCRRLTLNNHTQRCPLLPLCLMLGLNVATVTWWWNMRGAGGQSTTSPHPCITKPRSDHRILNGSKNSTSMVTSTNVKNTFSFLFIVELSSYEQERLR